MIKIIDLDGLFDKYIGDYVYKNIGKVKPEEIEDNMPVLYKKFGDEKLKELDDKTPNTFYREFASKELLECLKEHIEKKVSVSDFLYEALLAKEDCAITVREKLEEENGEEFTAYCINLLSDVNGEIPVERYLEFTLYDYPESIGELATENLCKVAEKVKGRVIEAYTDADEKKKTRLVEILSNTKKDDKVFDILINEFVRHQDNLSLYASYLVKFGDERAIPFLTKAIESENISYADFEELRFSIEALGGEYTKKRDFTADKTYKKIKGSRIRTIS